ncbi:MAG: CoA transferase subunit A [Desulfarculaceae bacterium]|nr:CoA transferase subunit A [Desulfarculaceae bacterium]
MIDKNTTRKEAAALVRDGASVMVGGFGVPGTPFILIDALLEQKPSNLTLIKNEANEDGMGISKIIEAGMCRKLITSHLGLNSTVIGMMNEKKIEVEFHPQGILAEKIRAGGAGLAGILTDIGIDTIISEGKTKVEVNGETVMVEESLNADVALIHAAKADRMGNMVYEKTARNFNPLMASAASTVIVETEEIVETGTLSPDEIHTPAAFVDHIVVIDNLTEEYGVLQSHVIQD